MHQDNYKGRKRCTFHYLEKYTRINLSQFSDKIIVDAVPRIQTNLES